MVRVSPVPAAAGAVVLLLSIPWSSTVGPALESAIHFVRSIILVAVIVTIACVAIRWVVPPVLEILTRPLQDSIAAMAGLVLLPEYALTTIMRRMGRPPFGIAYDLGDAIAWAVRTLRVTVQVVFDNLARVARGTHPAIVAVISGGIALGHVLGQ